MIHVNNSEIKLGYFPNGECNIDYNIIKKAISESKTKLIRVTFMFEDDKDIVHLMFVKRFLDELFPKRTIICSIKYMPYSRMDRANDHYIFTLKYLSEFINNLAFDKVLIYDPHSDVTPALLNNCLAVDKVKKNLSKILLDLDFDIHRDYLFFPDAGAQKRYADLVQFKICVGFKDRDFETGRIKSLKILGIDEEAVFQAEHIRVVILDDLCSKGGTFGYASEQLRELGFDEVFLIVGHCEQTVHEGNLLTSDAIDTIYTTTSMKRDKHHKIVIMEDLK